MQTYNQIIKLNRQFADAHYQIKTFGNGEAYNIVLHDKESWFTYPLMWMEDLSQNFNDNEFTYNFRVYFVAQVAQVRDEETDLESTNENEVKSDMIQCAQDLLSFWAKDTTYPELDLIKTGSIQTFTDKFSDRVTGCSVDLKLKQGFRYNKCAIPMSGVTPPPSVVCLPVQISINSVSFAELSSGASLDIPIQYENGTAVGTNVDGVITIPNPITCVDATVTVNDEAFNTVASGGTLDVPVEYVNGTPIGTNVDGIIQIPNPITCADVIVNINGELWAEVPSGDTENIIVRQSTGSTQVGEIQGAYYRIDDSVAVLKDTAGTIISSTDIKAEDSTDIVAPDSTVNLNGIFNQTVVSGGTANVIVGNSEITVNGAAFDSLVPEEALNVIVEYATAGAVGTIVGGTVVIPDPVIPNNSASLFKTGANISYQAQDDGELQFGNGVDFFTLNANNPFGNLNRFTDSLGTQIYANGIVIDWSTWNVGGATVRAYYNTLNAADTLTNQLDNQPYTQASFTGWYVCNYKELTNIFNLSITRDYLNYAPFNHSIGASTTRVWVSTRDSASVGIYYSGVSITVGNHSGVYQALLTREFTLTELGL